MSRRDYRNNGPRSYKKKRPWLYALGILVAIVLIVVVGAWGYVGSRIHQNPNLDNGKKTQIVNHPQKNPDVENILLIGIDGGQPGDNSGHRSDIMMVVSINRKENTLKLASLLRDIKVYYPEKGFYGKLNASYNYGGPEETVNMVNSNFKLDIQKYMVIDFQGFKQIIDTVGDVTVNLTGQEASQLRIGSTSGPYTLNGNQALAYVRTRYIDNDFNRTQRQRNVMLSIFNKFKNADLSTKVSAANQCLAYIKSNMPVYELSGSLLNVVSQMNGNVEQLEIPTEGDGMYTVEKSPVWYINLNWDREVAVLQKFIYGR